MKEKLKNMLDERRYRHSIGVRDTAVSLAKRFGEDENSAAIAGLLHDCAKNIEYAESVSLCKKLGAAVDAAELENPALIHAPLGAALAAAEFGVTDNDILNAIRYHTVGRAGMSKLEKIIYLADMIEPNRNFEGVDELRSMAEKSLDGALIAALKRSVIYNAQKERAIHTGSVEAYNDLIRKSKGKEQT